MAIVLHPLEQRLDRLGPEVEPLVWRRQRVRLVDEQHAVERPSDRTVGLDRRRADVLAHETRTIDFHQVATPEQSHRAIHLGEQARDRRLARARIAEEDEVLRGRDLRKTVPLALGLHLEERHQRPHLLLHGLESRQRIELHLELIHRPDRLGPPQLVGEPVGGIGPAGRLGDALPQQAQTAGDVL